MIDTQTAASTDDPHVAFQLALGAWPLWARPPDLELPACDSDVTGGFDGGDGRLVLTCATDPDELSGDREVGRVRYRAPEPLDLPVESVFLDSDLQLVAGDVTATPPG